MPPITRREFLGRSLTALGGVALTSLGASAGGGVAQAAVASVALGEHQLPPLPFAYDALKGLSKEVMTWHHDKHFAGYVKGRNAVEVALKAMDPASTTFDAKEYAGLKKQETFHASGEILHEVYFSNLGGDGGPGGQSVVEALRRDFGTLTRWGEDLKAAATAAGIGWGLTCWDPSCGRLVNFVVESHQLGAVWGAVPVVALDAWEHAYYHDYGPDKAKYFDVFLANLHWDRIDARFRAAGGQ
jgi:superoxide dismutase, Fe-Mn family